MIVIMIILVLMVMTMIMMEFMNANNISRSGKPEQFISEQLISFLPLSDTAYEDLTLCSLIC